MIAVPNFWLVCCTFPMSSHHIPRILARHKLVKQELPPSPGVIGASRGKADCLTQNFSPLFSQLGLYELLALLCAANSLSRSSAVDEDELPAVWLKVSWASSRNCFSGGWSPGAHCVKVNDFGYLFHSFLYFWVSFNFSFSFCFFFYFSFSLTEVYFSVILPFQFHLTGEHWYALFAVKASAFCCTNSLPPCTYDN